MKAKTTYEAPLPLAPWDEGLEQAVLGACLTDKDAFDEVAPILSERSFYKQEHQLIFQALRQMHSKGIGIDIITATNELSKFQEKPPGGNPWAYLLVQLSNRVTGAAHIEHHARALKEYEIKRDSIRIGIQLQREGSDPMADALEILDKMQEELYRITGHLGASQEQGASKLIAENYRVTRLLLDNPGKLLGIPSGLSELDKKLNGLQGSNLIVIAARPGMGKTALVLSFMRYQAVELGEPVAMFSLEMSAKEVMDRLISMQAHVPMSRISDPRKMNSEEMARYTDACETLSNCKIWIDDTPAISITEIRSKARRMHRKHGIRCVYVDYIQLCTDSMNKNRGQNREQEVSTISRGLKAVAKDLDIPVVALSQLSRNVEYRGDKRPILADLRESGSIEQDSDIVGFIYRPEYYQIKEDADGNSTRGIAEIIVAKYRNGATGPVLAEFSDEFMQFRDMEYDRMLRLDYMAESPIISQPGLPAPSETLPF